MMPGPGSQIPGLPADAMQIQSGGGALPPANTLARAVWVNGLRQAEFERLGVAVHPPARGGFYATLLWAPTGALLEAIRGGAVSPSDLALVLC